MAAREIDSNRAASEKDFDLGPLLSALQEMTEEAGKKDPSVLSGRGLKESVSAMKSSISELEAQISANRKEQAALLSDSLKLKKEIRELSNRLADEVSRLNKAAQAL